MMAMGTMQREIYDAFIEAGVSESKARAAAEVITEYRKADEVATKVDIAELRSDFAELKSEFAELKSDFAELKSEFAELKTEFAELKTEFAELKSEFKVEMANLETRLTRFIIVTNGIVIGLVVGLIKII